MHGRGFHYTEATIKIKHFRRGGLIQMETHVCGNHSWRHSNCLRPLQNYCGEKGENFKKKISLSPLWWVLFGWVLGRSLNSFNCALQASSHTICNANKCGEDNVCNKRPALSNACPCNLGHKEDLNSWLSQIGESSPCRRSFLKVAPNLYIRTVDMPLAWALSHFQQPLFNSLERIPWELVFSILYEFVTRHHRDWKTSLKNQYRRHTSWRSNYF